MGDLLSDKFANLSRAGACFVSQSKTYASGFRSGFLLKYDPDM